MAYEMLAFDVFEAQANAMQYNKSLQFLKGELINLRMVR